MCRYAVHALYVAVSFACRGFGFFCVFFLIWLHLQLIDRFFFLPVPLVSSAQSRFRFSPISREIIHIFPRLKKKQKTLQLPFSRTSENFRSLYGYNLTRGLHFQCRFHDLDFVSRVSPDVILCG